MTSTRVEVYKTPKGTKYKMIYDNDGAVIYGFVAEPLREITDDKR